MNSTIAEIQSALRDAALDGWLMYDFRRSNTIAYDVLGLSADAMATRRWFCYIPAQGAPVKITHAIEHWMLDAVEGTKKIYSSWRSLQSLLAETLRGAKRIAMEYSPGAAIPTVSCVDGGTLEMVRACGVEIVSSADLVQRFQAVWSDAQIAANLAAAKIMRWLVDDAFRVIGDALRTHTPITEFDVQQFLVRGYAAHNLTAEHPPICAVNANAAQPHYAPTARVFSPIVQGDVVLIDWWARPNVPDGTYVDLTWMGFAGSTVPPEVENIFGIVRDARDAGLNLVKDRFATKNIVRGYEVDDATRSVIDNAGFGEYFVHRTGHSIFTEDHGRGANMDNYETHDERAILPRTSFSIEPGIYLPGKFGVRSEIDVLIMPDGAVVVPCGEPQTSVVAILQLG